MVSRQVEGQIAWHLDEQGLSVLLGLWDLNFAVFQKELLDFTHSVGLTFLVCFKAFGTL